MEASTPAQVAVSTRWTESAERPEVSLDPEDWEGMRKLGHRMLDDMLDFLRGVREQPAWQPVPAEVAARFSSGPPLAGEGADSVYADFLRLVLPYRVGNIHPRFWGRVMGTGTVFGMLAEMLAGGMNSNGSGLASSNPLVESQVVEWLRQLMGFPDGTSGILLSGCSAANFVALAAARTAHAGEDVLRRGLASADAPLVLYASTETHNSVDRAVALLGLGTDNLRKIPVDEHFRIRLDALRDAVSSDRQAGSRPFCVIGNAGTVGTGATDDLVALADFAARERLWLHVDGAFGALAALSPSLRPALEGMARADSLAMDLHKWMYMPYGVACALIRHRRVHHRTFTTSAAYLGVARRGAEADPYRFNEWGPELSREFRALKVWMSIKEHGIERYARQIEQNVSQATYLAGLVRSDPELELLAPVPLNIVVFRYVGRGLPAACLDEVNAEILMRLHEQGIAVPTSGRVNGRGAIRVAITNHRSRREDFDLLAKSVVEIGREVAEDRV